MQRQPIWMTRLTVLLALVAGAETVRAQALPSGHVATSAVGQVGQRQVADVTDPLGRIDSRIPSRIPSRLRSRIDRAYDPEAKATTPAFAPKYPAGRRQF
ncbi:hypothetical protein [Sphingomonas phyllosphaerae]|uniref:hypothetical protein n=1 Tax=Sphingomonas phyllosphaerae TaxID=257003 RepID=UPI0012DE483F|nr:hypothetical protein [Sphingomonas phyllosphaerae]